MIYWPEYTLGRSPFSELRGLQREMNRLIDGASHSPASAVYPQLNMWSNGEEAVVTAEIPGFDPESMDISVIKDRMTLKAEREVEKPDENVVRHRAERSSGSFARTIQLPWDVDADKVSAAYRNGVLTIRLPRTEATKPKRVQIESA